MLSESVTKRNNGHPVALRVRNPQPEARTESPNGNLSQENEPTNRIPIRHTGQQPQSENRAESKTSQQHPASRNQQQPAYPATAADHSSTASSPTYTSRLSTGAEEDLVARPFARELKLILLLSTSESAWPSNFMKKRIGRNIL